MQDKTLKKIAFCCTIIGIVLLFFISESISIDEKEISQVDHGDIGRIVNISGTIRKISEGDNFAVIEIEKMDMMKIAIFKDKEIELKTGDEVLVVGKVEEYNGEMEIVGERIIKKN